MLEFMAGPQGDTKRVHRPWLAGHALSVTNGHSSMRDVGQIPDIAHGNVTTATPSPFTVTESDESLDDSGGLNAVD